MATGPRLLNSLPVLPVLLAAAVLAAGCAIPRWPVEGRISSGYGFRWTGVLPDIHRGVDIRVPSGTPVRSMAPGRIRFAGRMEGFGRVVWVDHGETVMSVYGHLSEIHVRTGQPVSHRAVLGLSGASGNADAPVLHFEIWRWGRPADPVPLLGGFPGDGG